MKARTIVVAIVVVGVTGSGWLVASRTKSPKQVLADAKPPKPSVLTERVTLQALTSSVIGRADVTIPEVPIVDRTKFAAGAVVTDVAIAAKQRLANGARILEVSDRPVFVLEGIFPLWRDIKTGDRGRDVKELQVALTNAGFPTGTTNGLFDYNTQVAVQRWYRTAGYEPTVAAQADPLQPAGIAIPRSELEFVAQLPARVLTVATKVGDLVAPASGGAAPASGDPASAPAIAAASTTLVTLAAGGPRIAFVIADTDRALVHAGSTATILNEQSNATVTATVTAVASTGVKAPDGTTTYPVTLAPNKPIPADFVGNVRVTVVGAATTGKVLSVPIAAVQSARDGSTFVAKATNSTPVTVAVVVGVSADGAVEVTPKSPDALHDGDRVVVG